MKILKKVYKFVFSFPVLFLIVSIGLFIGFTYYHELVHQEIFNDYDIPNYVDWWKEFPFKVVTVGYENVENCNEACMLSHNMNEVIGYHSLIILLMLFVGFSFIIMILYHILKRVDYVFQELRKDEQKTS